MTRDFTLDLYRELLTAFISKGYQLIAFEDYMSGNYDDKKVLILRHDVDDLPLNSLAKAEVEKSLHARASYYFRIVKQSNHPDVIRAIASLGHEIGYHYEDLALAHGKTDVAVKSFEKNLAYFRTFYRVSTICMHGSPASRQDNRDIWKTISYKDYSIKGEPYFDTDFEKVLYITDTGRKWNGDKVSVRDKVISKLSRGHDYHTTFDIIDAVHQNKLPKQVMITTHPQRWHNDRLPWMKELVFQNTKNIIKQLLFVKQPKA